VLDDGEVLDEERHDRQAPLVQQLGAVLLPHSTRLDVVTVADQVVPAGRSGNF